MQTRLKLKLYFFLLLVVLSGPVLARAQGTAFSYQGRMLQNGAAANGGHDFIFTLFDSAAGVGQIGPAVPLNNAPVIECRTNVAEGEWTTLPETTRVGTGAPIELTLTNALNQSKQFYRVKRLP